MVGIIRRCEVVGKELKRAVIADRTSVFLAAMARITAVAARAQLLLL